MAELSDRRLVVKKTPLHNLSSVGSRLRCFTEEVPVLFFEKKKKKIDTRYFPGKISYEALKRNGIKFLRA